MRRGGLYRAISSCTNQAICEGKNILVHCINGRHRSTQVVATSLRPFHPNAEKAMDEVFWVDCWATWLCYQPWPLVHAGVIGP